MWAALAQTFGIMRSTQLRSISSHGTAQNWHWVTNQTAAMPDVKLKVSPAIQFLSGDACWILCLRENQPGPHFTVPVERLCGHHNETGLHDLAIAELDTRPFSPARPFGRAFFMSKLALMMPKYCKRSMGNRLLFACKRRDIVLSWHL